VTANESQRNRDLKGYVGERGGGDMTIH